MTKESPNEKTKVRARRQLAVAEKRVIICDKTGGPMWMKCASGDDVFKDMTLKDGTMHGLEVPSEFSS